MTYKGLADVNATTDVSNLFIYVNELTNNIAMPLVLGTFFLIAFIGSYYMQIRTRGSGRWDFSFAAGGFVAFGMAVLMSLKDGLLSPIWLVTSLAVAILGVFILYLSRES